MKISPRDSIDYYAVLGISSDATQADIQAAWRKSVLIHHPDKSNLLSQQEEPRGTGSAVHDGTGIRLINEARFILGDPQRRKEWEEQYGRPLLSPSLSILTVP